MVTYIECSGSPARRARAIELETLPTRGLVIRKIAPNLVPGRRISMPKPVFWSPEGPRSFIANTEAGSTCLSPRCFWG